MTRLNLCCGTNVFPNWINIDKTDVDGDYLRHMREAHPDFRWPDAQQPIADAVKRGTLTFKRHDVREGLPFSDGSVDAIYIGQAIEHFNRRTEAPRLLRECRRVLKQYGVIKLTTPDLYRIASVWAVESADGDWGFQDQGMEQWDKDQPAFYADAEPDDRLAYLLFGASGDNCTAENYEGHFHCYTPKTLGLLLGECGFDQRSKDSPEFTDTLDMGMSHSFAIEGCKP